MLRRLILAYGVLAILGGIALLLAGVGPGIVIYLLCNGVVVVAAILFERGRYSPEAGSGGGWQETDERFVDPTTGQLMKVRYNPQTGARDYVPAPPAEGGRQLP